MIVLRACAFSALFTFSTATLQAAERIIVVHGSFSSESKWCRPGGLFYEALKKSTKNDESFVTPFIWSGGVSPQSIIQGAGALAELIISLPPHIPVRICAHSNGGNVSAYATMLLAALYQTQTTVTTVPQEELPESLKKPFQEKKLTKNRTCLYDLAPTTERTLEKTFAHLKQLFNEGTRLRRTLPDYPIQTVYFMGTPLNTNLFDVDMSVVRHVINLYSRGDIIQPLVGKQTLPPHERRANLQALLHHAAAEEPCDPCHKNIRHPSVGQWLLGLENLIAGKESAALDALQSGVITFYEDKAPSFKPGDTEQFLKEHSPQSCVSDTSSPTSVSAEEEEDFDWDFCV